MKKFLLTISNLQDETTTLSRNVGNQIRSDVATHLRTELNWIRTAFNNGISLKRPRKFWFCVSRRLLHQLCDRRIVVKELCTMAAVNRSVCLQQITTCLCLSACWSVSQSVTRLFGQPLFQACVKQTLFFVWRMSSPRRWMNPQQLVHCLLPPHVQESLTDANYARNCKQDILIYGSAPRL